MFYLKLFKIIMMLLSKKILPKLRLTFKTCMKLTWINCKEDSLLSLNKSTPNRLLISKSKFPSQASWKKARNRDSGPFTIIKQTISIVVNGNKTSIRAAVSYSKVMVQYSKVLFKMDLSMEHL